MIRNLIFDFDGTIADTTRGIILCTQATLREMGLPVAADERIQATIGLPLRTCFELGTDTPEERLDEAVVTYRRLFDDVAVPHVVLFDGVMQTLQDLHDRGLRLSIATSRSGASSPDSRLISSITAVRSEMNLSRMRSQAVFTSERLRWSSSKSR